MMKYLCSSRSQIYSIRKLLIVQCRWESFLIQRHRRDLSIWGKTTAAFSSDTARISRFSDTLATATAFPQTTSAADKDSAESTRLGSSATNKGSAGYTRGDFRTNLAKATFYQNCSISEDIATASWFDTTSWTTAEGLTCTSAATSVGKISNRCSSSFTSYEEQCGAQ